MTVLHNNVFRVFRGNVPMTITDFLLSNVKFSPESMHVALPDGCAGKGKKGCSCALTDLVSPFLSGRWHRRGWLGKYGGGQLKFRLLSFNIIALEYCKNIIFFVAINGKELPYEA